MHIYSAKLVWTNVFFHFKNDFFKKKRSKENEGFNYILKLASMMAEVKITPNHSNFPNSSGFMWEILSSID